MASITFTSAGGINATGPISASAVYNAVWNDLADAIEVPEGTVLEYGRCYCFDGKNYYKSTGYMAPGVIGIHSDTYGFRMGEKVGKPVLSVAVAGFVLAYVDKEYPVGTPLTCSENGTLTEISLEDKRNYPEGIVATYWRKEPLEVWGDPNTGREVAVNGRCWVKIR